jgi:hypothetical protein
MPNHPKDPPDTHQPRLAEEIRRMQSEPLLPIEKQLITWSLVLGVALLLVLVWVSRRFFPT